MDITTTSTVGGGDEVLKSRYVSCIKVNGVPILPPLMTEERRAEMKRYKELAILKEGQLRDKRIASHAANDQKERAVEREKSFRRSRSSSASPPLDGPVTSTPRIPRVQAIFGANGSAKPITATAINFEELSSTNKPTSGNEKECTNETAANSSDVPEGILRERTVIVLAPELNKSHSSDPSGRSSSVMSFDGDEGKVKVDVVGTESECDGNESVENFASATFSTGTFVIRKSDEVDKNADHCDDHLDSDRKSKDSIPSVTVSEDEGENAPQTVVRKPLEEPIFSRRKRPAKFFEDDTKDGNSTPATSSSREYLPNAVPDDEMGSSGRLTTSKPSMSFSPVPYTNFTSIAKSLTKEFTQKVCATLSSSSFSSGQAKRYGEGYTAETEKDIISSELGRDYKDVDTISNSSDKENINTLLVTDSSKGHVRKLSYTLAEPSAVLLEAVSKEKNFKQALETVPSAPSSVGIQSAQPTPEKPARQQTISVNDGKPKQLNLRHIPDPSLFQETPRQNDPGLSSALANLNLGRGKQAHLERFLGDQEDRLKANPVQSTKTVQDDQLKVLFNQMMEDQERKLRDLAEQHRKQELLIRQQFESEIEKLKEKLNSTLSTTSSSFKASPNSLVDSALSTTRSPPRPTTAATEKSATLSPEEATDTISLSNKILTSGMSGLSFSDQTRSESAIVSASSVYQFKGDNGGVMPSSFTKHNATGASGGEVPLAGVGLFKLQSKMQLMSPSLFRIPIDAKSPLLKGLVFPDPLEKPHMPIKIPPKALDPIMKAKFDRISAAVKGFLTRRLLHTEKVQIIVQTIRDTVDLLMKLYEEAPVTEIIPSVKPQDHELHQRLIQQLTGACRSFHDVFFKLTTKERMAIIASDREKLKAKALRLMSSPSKPNLSNATLKSIERRMSHRASPKRDTRKQRPSKAFDPLAHGSMSVKPKPIKSFNISPKRRRISYWDERNSVARSSSTYFGKSDMNGNHNAAINSARSQASTSSKSLRTYPVGAGSGGIGDTFIVPSSAPSSSRSVNLAASVYGGMKSSGSGRKDSIASATGKSNSARSTQSTVTSSVYNMRTSSGRSSFSRQKPWK